MGDENDIPEIEDELLPTEEHTVDAASPAEQRKRSLSAKQQARATDDWWREALSTPQGRFVLWGILQSCHTFEDRFACGPNGFPQSEATWFQAGEQSIGLRLHRSWMRIDFSAVNQMHVENDSAFAKRPPPTKADA